MTDALVIGGTGFIGRHTTAELLDHSYDVTVVSRGRRAPPKLDEAVTYEEGDRTDAEALEATADEVAPEVVVDCALFQPDDARRALDVFADVEAYVYVSSGGAYARHDLPKREADTPLHDFDPADAGDDSMATYGPRKAECDRIVRAAADRGVAATAVRPTMVYGPQTVDGTGAAAGGPVSWASNVPGIREHHDYWIDRLERHDRVVVPGDGTAIWHRVYVEDLARALRVVAETGTPGEAYNAADRKVLTLEDVVDLIAETLDTTVDVVHASRRELQRVDLTPDDFVLYHHMGYNYPHVLDTCKLAALGWHSTPPREAMARTVAESVASDRDGSAFDPGRDAEERFLESIAE